MIRRIYSSDKRFKNLSFKPGLNLLVADKTDQSNIRNTRNGSGKSSFVELVNFLLGSGSDSTDLPRLPDLEDHRFSLEFDISGYPVVASRSGSDYNRVFVRGDRIDNQLGNLFASLEFDEETNGQFLTVSKWRDVLGDRLFNLGEEVRDSPRKNRPTFRSLISYFIRRQSDGGFAEAEKHYKNQLTWDYQVNLSYLFGLDWRISQEWQQVRDSEKSIDALRTALRQGVLGGEIIENAGKLRTQLTIAEKERDDMRLRLSRFTVLEDYQRLENEASALTQRINSLADANASDRILVRELQQSLDSEVPPPYADLRRLYRLVGVELPSIPLERFEQVSRFHESVIENRRSFLSQEINEAQRRVSEREIQQAEADNRRAIVMNTLQTSGALQQFTALQAELARQEAIVEAIRQKYELARQLDSKKAELDILRGRLSERLQRDLDEREATVKDAILTFESISEALYEDPGSLTIEPTENGPEFGTVIQARRSKGKNNMQIFCFDLTLAILNSGKRMPGFLIHDSHLFDGADERQIGMALSIGARMSEEHNFQYIVTMNTDDIPKQSELPNGFSLEPYINEVRLTDATEEGGLFGFRFG